MLYGDIKMADLHAIWPTLTRQYLHIKKAFLLSLPLALLMSCSSHVDSSSATLSATRKVYVSPVESDGTPANGFRITRIVNHGACATGSETIGQAYRCTAENGGIYDPCWVANAPTPTVLCLSEPWSNKVTEVLLDGRIGPADKVNGVVPPWGMQLSSGQQCHLLDGSHDIFEGHPIDYYCDGDVWVLRGLARQVGEWHAETVKWRNNHYVKGRPAEIAIAWFGIPDRS
jgi:hypothetical protein